MQEPTESTESSTQEVAVEVPAHPGKPRPSSKSTRSTLSQIATEKGLVCVQLIVLLKLLFDLMQAVVGFLKLLGLGLDDQRCCGYQLDPLQLRPLSLGQIVSVPFIILILIELLILLRSFFSTKNKPSEEDTSDELSDDEEAQQKPKRSYCKKILSYSAKALLGLLNKILLINPFFGCLVAWMLLYQSNRSECLLVLGLEVGSILLHFIAVWLTEESKSRSHFLVFGLPLMPFILTVALVLIYMKQQGVCYLVEGAVFHFQGCELCPDGYPPIDGSCMDQDGKSFEFDTHNIFDVGNWDSVTSKSSEQGTFCGNGIGQDHNRYEDGKWENTHFCFFPYE